MTAFPLDLALSRAQRTVLGCGLPIYADGRIEPSPALAVGAAVLDELVRWASDERLTGLLALTLAAGAIVADPTAGSDLDDVVETAHLAALRTSLAAEATGVVAVAALRRAGIEPYLFKGMANAHLDYADPAERTFYDADIVVPSEQIAPAIDVLTAAGFDREGTPLGPGWERRFARAVELRYRDGVELDLHGCLATGYFGWTLDHDRLRSERAVVDLGGDDVFAFGPTGRLLISCYAVELSRGPGLRLLRDVAQQLLVTDADWRTAARWAGDGQIVIARALLRLRDALECEHESFEWAERVEPTPTARQALEYAASAHTRGWSADARSTMLALGPGDRIRYIAGIAGSRIGFR